MGRRAPASIRTFRSIAVLAAGLAAAFRTERDGLPPWQAARVVAVLIVTAAIGYVVLRAPRWLVGPAVRGAAPVVDSEWFTRALLETGELRIIVDWWPGCAPPTPV